MTRWLIPYLSLGISVGSFVAWAMVHSQKEYPHR